jgi:TonB family protein
VIGGAARRLAAFLTVFGLAAAAPAVAQAPRIIHIPAHEYPADVAPGEDPLRVQVRYELADDGRFSLCEVRRSSGHASLDAASCRLLQERARFRPEPGLRRGTLVLMWLAADPDSLNPVGAPIPVALQQEIFDADYPAEAMRRNESGRVTYDVDVSATGVPLRCTVSESSGSAVLDRRTCEIVMERTAYIPASNGAGGTARGIYRGSITWRLDVN